MFEAKKHSFALIYTHTHTHSFVRQKVFAPNGRQAKTPIFIMHFWSDEIDENDFVCQHGSRFFCIQPPAFVLDVFSVNVVAFVGFEWCCGSYFEPLEHKCNESIKNDTQEKLILTK